MPHDNIISDPPPLFEHETVSGIPCVTMRGITVCCPAVLRSIAQQIEHEAKVLTERQRDARIIAEELDAGVEADEIESEVEMRRREVG